MIPVDLTLAQVQYLTACLWVRLDEDPGDPVARELFARLKEATVRMGEVWTYGELPREPRAGRWQRRGERRPGGTWVREGNS